MIFSVVLITHNEEANIERTLKSVQSLVAHGKGEIVVVDSGSNDRTVEIAQSFGAKVFVEEWKGYASQKNSAIDKASGEWILSLDADEEVEAELLEQIVAVSETGNLVEVLNSNPNDPLGAGEKVAATKVMAIAERHALNSTSGFQVSRKNLFLGRWIRHGGFWPDPKLRLFRRGAARFEDRAVHEDAKLTKGFAGTLQGALLHHSYPTLADYIDHMNRYSSLGAEMVKSKAGFSVANILVRPMATFMYNYFVRAGFLDGHEGLLLHLYHSIYVSWKYAKTWEASRKTI